MWSENIIEKLSNVKLFPFTFGNGNNRFLHEKIYSNRLCRGTYIIVQRNYDIIILISPKKMRFLNSEYSCNNCIWMRIFLENTLGIVKLTPGYRTIVHRVTMPVTYYSLMGGVFICLGSLFSSMHNWNWLRSCIHIFILFILKLKCKYM